MCVFCAAIPAAGALGAAASAKQKQARRDESARLDVPAWVLALPAERTTLVIVGGLLAGSVIYHSQISPT